MEGSDMVLPLIGVIVGIVALVGLPIAMIAAAPKDDEMPNIGELAADGLEKIGWISEGIFYGAIKSLPVALVVVLLFNLAGRVTEKVVGEEL